ncbi:hypothetical protein ACLB2K_041067 [Fragaria x ananassa]
MASGSGIRRAQKFDDMICEISGYFRSKTRDRFWIAFGSIPVAFLAHEGWRGLAACDEDFVQKILILCEIRCPRGILISSSRGTLQCMARSQSPSGLVPDFPFVALLALTVSIDRQVTEKIKLVNISSPARWHRSSLSPGLGPKHWHAQWDGEFTFLIIIEKSDDSPYRRPSISCLKHKSPQYKPHNSAACRSLTKEEILARFGNPDHTKTTMADSRPTSDAGPTLSTEEVRKMFEELRSDLKNEIGALRSELGLKVEDLSA